MSGAVGTYSATSPDFEARVLARLGLEREPVSTQVVARDRHAELLQAIALAGAGLERFATEVRHLARTEVGEVREPFGRGQKGSSSMPHKRNPIKSEQVTGLARVLRGNATAAVEDVALWHERDISHSSVERIILPDSTILLDHMQRRVLALVEGMVVDAARMRENLELTYGALFSQRVLLALVAAGSTRDDAYRVVQRARPAGAGRAHAAARAAGGRRARLPGLDLDAIFDYASFVGTRRTRSSAAWTRSPRPPRRRSRPSVRSPSRRRPRPGRGERGVELAQRGGQPGGELAAGVGEGDAPARALEQAHAQLALERHDAAAERRRRHPEAGGGASEVQLVDEHADRAQLTQFDHDRATVHHCVRRNASFRGRRLDPAAAIRLSYAVESSQGGRG